MTRRDFATGMVVASANGSLVRPIWPFTVPVRKQGVSRGLSPCGFSKVAKIGALTILKVAKVLMVMVLKVAY